MDGFIDYMIYTTELVWFGFKSDWLAISLLMLLVVLIVMVMLSPIFMYMDEGKFDFD